MPAITATRQFFLEAGYDASYIRENYNYAWRAADGNLVNDSLPLVAFGATPFNMRSACFAYAEAPSEQELEQKLYRLRFLAAPLALISIYDRVELWAIQDNRSPVRLQHAKAAQWTTTMKPRLREFSPELILAAKRGERQLTFVDAGLIKWAEKIAEETLVTLLEGLLASAASSLPKSQRDRADARLAILRLIFHLFACRVLEDKGVIAQAPDAATSLRAAQERFSENIDPAVLDSPFVDVTLVQFVHGELRNRFAFSSLTTEMLGYAYENALVTTKLRRKHGIYYTPRSVTTQIVSRLPIESIDQDQRVLADPCCGSGSFLLAGFERLNSLLPSTWTPARRHQYLRARIIGSDIDDFATEVASLSLVVTDPENRNGWQISNRDVLELDRSAFRGRPTVILTNPPFKEIKVGGTRRELASEILVHLVGLLAPGGLLGIVLPQSILDSRAGREGRQTVLKSCELLEIDTLPGGLFQSSTETALFMVKKRFGLEKPKTAPVTIRELRAKDLPKFRATGACTATYSIDPTTWQVDPTRRFIITPFSDIWERLERMQSPLGKVADVRNGLRLRPDDQTSVSSHKRPGGDVPFVDRLDVLRPFALLQELRPTKWLRYGDQLDRPRDESIFKSQKVLINSNRKPGNAWRIVAAPAPAGLYFSDNFHGVLPKDNATSIEKILAVLNNPVANAWFDAHCKKRKVVQSILEELPFPAFDSGSSRQLEVLVRRLRDSVIAKWKAADQGLFYDGLVETFDTGTLLEEIDGIVFRAYGLDVGEIRAIEKYMGSDKRPG